MLLRVTVRVGELGLTGDGDYLVIEEWCHQIRSEAWRRAAQRNSEGLRQIRELILL